MHKIILIIRSLSALALVCGLFFILIAPETVALHITANNVVDSSGSKYMLLLEPLLVIIINEIAIWKIKQYRRAYTLTTVPVILVKEWYYISAAVLLVIIFGFVMYQQVTFSI